ncbi:MAG: hypothetical protein V4596_10505 [Bdellovibrionota bacterium]
MSHKNPTMTDQELIEAMAEIVIQKIDPIEKIKRSEARKIKSNKAKSDIPTQTQINRIISSIKQPTSNAPLLPPTEVKSKNPRYIPSTIKQEVYMRDKGQLRPSKLHF